MKATFLFVIFFMLSVTGCTIDNYEMPELTLSGRIVDSETSKLVESGGNNAGSIIRLYEGDATQPVTCRTYPDGTFSNTRVFPGSYSYEPEGPFTPVSSTRESIEIKNNTAVEIQVIPHVRVSTELIEVTATSAKVKLTYQKVNMGQVLAMIGVVWSTFPNPNTSTFAGGAILQDNVASQNPASGEKVYTLTNLKPKTKYYLRGLARTNNTGNYYNYNTQFEIQTQ
ncbi:MAG TPA: hypothetical protein VGD22_19320 [Sphingobacteriaceae bacterium]